MPATPTGLTVSAATQTSITWIWNAVEGANSYVVQISVDETFGDDDPIEVAPTPTYTVINLPASTSLYLRVASVRTFPEYSLWSEWSTHVTGMTAESERPAPPTGLRVSAATDNSITWIWNTVEGASAYAVQLSVDGMFGDDDPAALALEPTYTVSDLPASSSFYLRVASVRTLPEYSLWSEWSTHVPGMTAEPEPPAPPTGLTVFAATDNSITWIWNAVEGASAYAVQISVDEMFGDDDPIELALTPTYTVADLPASTSVYLRVAGVKTSLGDSLRGEWSTHVTGMTAAPVPLPGPPPSPDRPFSGTEVLPGVALLTSPVESLPDRDWVRTTVELRVSADAYAGAFEWFTPYARADEHSATFWANIVEWRVELFESGATLHTLDIEWPADKEVGLRFRSGNTSGGEQPMVRCTASACSVTR